MAMLERSASGTQHLRWAQQIDATIKAYITIANQSAFAHLMNPSLRVALDAEHATLTPLIVRLAEANAAYRNFLDQGFVEARALQRVADFACDEAQRELDVLTRGKDEEVARHVTGGIKALRSGHALSRVVRAGRGVTVSLARGSAALVRILPEAMFPMAPGVAERLDAGATLLEGYLDLEQDTIEVKRVALRANVRQACNTLREALEQMNGRLRTHATESFIESLYPALTSKGRKVGELPEDEDDLDADFGTPAAGPTGPS